LKIYRFNWKTVRPNRSLQFNGKVTVVASSFEEAIDKAETKVRGLHPYYEDLPLTFIQEKNDNETTNK